MMYFKGCQLQDANIQLLQRLTMKDSGPKWAWLQLGLQYLDHGDALQAIKAFQRVIRADPNDRYNQRYKQLYIIIMLSNGYPIKMHEYKKFRGEKYSSY